MNEAGDITTIPSNDERDDRTTALQHSSTNGDTAVDDTAVAFDDLALKKKKKSKKPKEGTEEASTDAPAADADFDPTALKKKKKKKAVKVEDAEVEDFEAKLAAAGALEKEGEEEAAPAAEETPAEVEGDMKNGTGIWAHDATDTINYNLLLGRFFTLLNEFNPGLMSSGTKSYKIPPPQCLREGNKKTIFANIADIGKVRSANTSISREDLTSSLANEAIRRAFGSVPFRRVRYYRQHGW